MLKTMTQFGIINENDWFVSAVDIAALIKLLKCLFLMICGDASVSLANLS